MVAVTAGGWLMWGVLASMSDTPAENPRPEAAEQTAPSLEMLLYLAEFEDAEGRWIDPMAVVGTEPEIVPVSITQSETTDPSRAAGDTATQERPE